jgi:hypothetical protein
VFPQSKCVDFEQVQQYLKDHIEKVKEFVAGVVKKLPQFEHITVSRTENLAQRAVVLHFKCSITGYEHQVKVKDWQVGLKMAYLFIHAGVAVFEVAHMMHVWKVEDALKALMGMYETYQKGTQEEEWNKFASSPFLLASEQDLLITELAGAGFFDAFEYDAQTAGWVVKGAAGRASTPVHLPAPPGSAARAVAVMPVPKPREGLLQRKGHKFPYNWSLRLFVLMGEELLWLDTKSREQKGKLVFAGGMGCTVREEAEEGRFTVVCGGKEELLQAASAAERTAWMAAITWCMDKSSLQAMPQCSLALLQNRLDEAHAAVSPIAKEWESRVAAKQAELQAAMVTGAQTGEWEAAKKVKEEVKAVVQAAAAAGGQEAVHAAQERLAECMAWERLLQANVEGAQARKQRLKDEEDFVGLQALEAEIAAIQRPLRCLQMPAEEAAEEVGKEAAAAGGCWVYFCSEEDNNSVHPTPCVCCCSPISTRATHTDCVHATDQHALNAIFCAFGGPTNWRNMAGWMTDTPLGTNVCVVCVVQQRGGTLAGDSRCDLQKCGRTSRCMVAASSSWSLQTAT